jgi:hypothetical protein
MKLKKIKKKTETGSNRPVSVRLFLDKNQFKPVWLGFFPRLGSVQVFWFQAYKIETEPVSFFKILIGFFSSFGFFSFFFCFLSLIGFLVFFSHPYITYVYVEFLPYYRKVENLFYALFDKTFH